MIIKTQMNAVSTEMNLTWYCNDGESLCPERIRLMNGSTLEDHLTRWFSRRGLTMKMICNGMLRNGLYRYRVTLYRSTTGKRVCRATLYACR